MSDFLPINDTDMQKRGWKQADFVLVTGDAYVDHPSFGASVISRVLERAGYKVAILAQPDYKSPADFKRFGRPRLGFLVTAGNLDSMVNHYTAAKKPRSSDAYSPGGQAGLRPDRASLVYATRAREAYSGTTVILGGLEASLRRFSHYDYWSDKVRRSVLVDSKADILVYGMAESSILDIAARLNAGEKADSIRDVRGTVIKSQVIDDDRTEVLPDYEIIVKDKKAFAESFYRQYVNTDPFSARPLAEKHFDYYIIQNPPSMPLSREEMDRIYELPFTKTPHPVYEAMGGIPAIEEIRYSLVSSRGCYGACNFCSLAFHQGRIIQSRSHQSIIDEAIALTDDPDFKGYIHDVGGPTANFRDPSCGKQETEGACTTKNCLSPKPCKKLKVSHEDYLKLLRSLRNISKVKKVFVRSGVRFDYLMLDDDKTFFKELVEHHVSGQLKVAPEHISDTVLQHMGKPPHEVYESFKKEFETFNRQAGKKQFIVPYFISSHPGAGLKEAIELALYFRKTAHIPEQVQDFYPTPGTLSTCMYHTEMDPRTGKPVYVAKNFRDKAMQRALLQFNRKENHQLVREALMLAGRADLVGNGPACLVPYATQKSKAPYAHHPGKTYDKNKKAGYKKH